MILLNKKHALEAQPCQNHPLGFYIEKHGEESVRNFIAHESVIFSEVLRENLVRQNVVEGLKDTHVVADLQSVMQLILPSTTIASCLKQQIRELQNQAHWIRDVWSAYTSL